MDTHATPPATPHATEQTMTSAKMVNANFPIHKPIMLKAIKKVVLSYGGSLEDLSEEMGWLYWKACISWNPDLGRAFTSHLFQVVYHDLISLRRKELNRKRIAPPEPNSEVALESLPCRTPDPFAEKLNTLSPDAQLLAETAIDPPECVRLTSSGRPHISSLREHMRREYGFTANLYNECSLEIQNVLKS